MFTLLMFRKPKDVSLESQIRQQLKKIKRQIFIGQRPFDSRLYLDISRSF
jgi:hypothetical protein